MPPSAPRRQQPLLGEPMMPPMRQCSRCCSTARSAPTVDRLRSRLGLRPRLLLPRQILTISTAGRREVPHAAVNSSIGAAGTPASNKTGLPSNYAGGDRALLHRGINFDTPRLPLTQSSIYLFFIFLPDVLLIYRFWPRQVFEDYRSSFFFEYAIQSYWVIIRSC